MGVSSGRSRIADLSFQVFGRSIHPDWLATRRHRRITQVGWEADVRIIEGGHAITWACGPVRLTEILCGPETPLPEPGLLFHSGVRHERSADLRPAPGIEYQSCFEVERVDPEVFAHLSDELTLDATRGALFHRFAASSRMAASPISRVHVESRARGLSIQSFHTFPDERAIVRAQSLFEVRAAVPHR
jgi:hypothetical protein